MERGAGISVKTRSGSSSFPKTTIVLLHCLSRELVEISRNYKELQPGIFYPFLEQ